MLRAFARLIGALAAAIAIMSFALPATNASAQQQPTEPDCPAPLCFYSQPDFRGQPFYSDLEDIPVLPFPAPSAVNTSDVPVCLYSEPGFRGKQTQLPPQSRLSTIDPPAQSVAVGPCPGDGGGGGGEGGGQGGGEGGGQGSGATPADDPGEDIRPVDDPGEDIRPMDDPGEDGIIR
ncbi:peptidase inhibitor family I36 protein [Streptomyces sp. B6B3]|uniref:peptidase inhibitor family I36 protein n=1 Tax=Streptomyces sp. B6B3 TaxID=3153570 RepID=UPI00325E5F2C